MCQIKIQSSADLTNIRINYGLNEMWISGWNEDSRNKSLMQGAVYLLMKAFFSNLHQRQSDTLGVCKRVCMTETETGRDWLNVHMMYVFYSDRSLKLDQSDMTPYHQDHNQQNFKYRPLSCHTQQLRTTLKFLSFK